VSDRLRPPAVLTQGSRPPVPVGWGLEPVWMWWWGEGFLAPAGAQAPGHLIIKPVVNHYTNWVMFAICIISVQSIA